MPRPDTPSAPTAAIARRMLGLAVVLVLLPTAAGQFLDAIAADEGLLLTVDRDDPRHDPERALDGGQAGLERITWSLPWDQGRYLAGNFSAAARIGTDVGVWQAEVSMQLTSGGRIVATGDAQAVALRTDFTTLLWNGPVAPGEVVGLWWNITANGTYSSLFLDVGGDTTHIVLPAAQPPPPPVEEEQRNVSASSLRATRTLEGAYLHQQIHWRGAPGELVVQWNATLEDGLLAARLVAPDGSTPWQRTWPGGGGGRQNVSASPGNWTLHIEADGVTGHYDIHMQERAAPGDVARQRSPWPLAAAVVGLWIAAKRR